MKVILSRKGFDSSVGGHASPILPDGRMVSLPIPSSIDRIGYQNLSLPGRRTYADLMHEIGAGARIDGKGAHLDPDLVAATRPRKRNWRPTLGQVGSAAGHLKNQHVGEGDLFLFYGWFSTTHIADGRLRLMNGGFHAIFGYLQIGRVIQAQESTELPPWLEDHPHSEPQRMAKRTNVIYVAADELDGDRTQPAAGTFLFNPSLMLTKQGHTRSRWSLDPDVFRHLSISYHDETAWRHEYFQSYPRAQEYVVQADARAARWAYELIRGADQWC